MSLGFNKGVSRQVFPRVKICFRGSKCAHGGLHSCRRGLAEELPRVASGAAGHTSPSSKPQGVQHQGRSRSKVGTTSRGRRAGPERRERGAGRSVGEAGTLGASLSRSVAPAACLPRGTLAPRAAAVCERLSVGEWTSIPGSENSTGGPSTSGSRRVRGEGPDPCTRGGTERGKQGLCASKNRCPQGPRGPSCHPGLSPVNNVAAMSLESPGARASSILFQYQVLFKALPPVPRDSSPRGWPSEREVGGRAGLSTHPPPSRPNRLQGWGREKGEEKKKGWGGGRVAAAGGFLGQIAASLESPMGVFSCP